MTGRLVLAGAVMALSGGRALSQEPTPASLAVSTYERGTAVAVAVRAPAGSRYDEPGLEGTAWLLGKVLESEANGALDTAGALVSVSVDRNDAVLTLLSVPEAWPDALAVVLDLVLRGELDARSIESARADLLADLSFEGNAPVRAFETEVPKMLAPLDLEWSRPARGGLASVARMDRDNLTRFRDERYRTDVLSVAVVGAVRAADVLAWLRRPAAVDLAHIPRAPVLETHAWQEGSRTHLVQEVTSAWIAVAYPVHPSTERTTLELLGHVIQEDLTPSPPDPDVYNAGVRVDDTPGGTVLVVESTVSPEAAGRWEARVLDVVRDLAREPLEEAFFRWRRRRFRAVRLLEEAAPERKAVRLTHDLTTQGIRRDLSDEIWSQDADGVWRAARTLGDPRVLVLGPDLTGDRSPG